VTGVELTPPQGDSIVGLERVDFLPPGVVRVHFGSVDTALFPRGPMMKNSIGELLLERLRASRDHWTSESYGDSVGHEEATESLVRQLRAEVERVISDFELD